MPWPSSKTNGRSSARCLATSSFRVYASREDDNTVTVVHEWTDQSSFAAYLASDAFARSNAVLRPLVTDGPVSRRFRAELVESVA